MTAFEKKLLEVLMGINASLDALVLLNAPEGAGTAEGCDHDWVDLMGEKQCRKCHARG